MAQDKTVVECWVIIIILGIAAYMFRRSHKRVWAASVFPLMLVPIVNIIFSPINRRIAARSTADAFSARIVIYIIVFAVVCVWVVLWGSRRLPAGSSRYAYIAVSIAFTLILLLIFLRNLVFRPYFGM